MEDETKRKASLKRLKTLLGDVSQVTIPGYVNLVVDIGTPGSTVAGAVWLRTDTQVPAITADSDGGADLITNEEPSYVMLNTQPDGNPVICLHIPQEDVDDVRQILGNQP